MPKNSAVATIEHKDLERSIQGEVDVATMLMRAVELNLDVEKMERLYALREQIKAEHARESFYRAIAEFQAICPKIPKRRQVMQGDKVRYKYASIDDITEVIKAPLAQTGLSYSWKPETIYENNKPTIKSTCVIKHVDGHKEESEFTVPVMSSDFMNQIQWYGSARTYANRYSLCDALGISPEDDDDADTIPRTDTKTMYQPERKSAATAKKPEATMKPAPAKTESKASVTLTKEDTLDIPPGGAPNLPEPPEVITIDANDGDPNLVWEGPFDIEKYVEQKLSADETRFAFMSKGKWHSTKVRRHGDLLKPASIEKKPIMMQRNFNKQFDNYEVVHVRLA